MRTWTRAVRVIGACLLALTATACGSSGEETVEQVDEVLVRTAASNLGQQELAKAGAEVSGPLSCSTTRQEGGVDISCSGTTLDGRAVEVTGTATSLPGGNTVKGNFVGTAAGQQVFSLECLGC